MAFNNKKDNTYPADSLTNTEIVYVQTGAAGVIQILEGSAPSPTTGYGKIYVKSSDHLLYFKNASGAETQLGSGGTGDVVGPASAVDSNFAAFNTTTGKLIKDSGYNASSFLTSLSGALLADGSVTGATSNIQPFTMGITGGASGLALTAGGTNQNITLTPSGTGYTILNGNIGIGTTTPASRLHVGVAPTASANYGTLSIGGGAFDGSTSGYFVGSASGTSLAVNEVTGYSGKLIDAQIGSVSRFNVNSLGQVFAKGQAYGTPTFATSDDPTSGFGVPLAVPGVLLFYASGSASFQARPNGYLNFHRWSMLATGDSAEVMGADQDDATAHGMKIGNENALTTAGGKIVSFYSDGFSTERAYIDYLGGAYFNGNVGIGTTTPTTGKLVIVDTALAGSAALAGSVLDLAQTWNTTGTPTSIKLNVTDTASNAASLLLDIGTGGGSYTSKFKVDKNGYGTFASGLTLGGILTATNVNFGYATTATAAGTTTLTVASARDQYFTGVTTQTVVLPDATTLVLGYNFRIHNNSTGLVTVNASGGGAVWILGASSEVLLTCTNIGSAAGIWDVQYIGTGIASGKKLSFANSISFAGTDGTVITFPAVNSTLLYSGGALGTPASGTLTNATGLPIAGLVSSTSTALGVGSIELGHATDTTIARVSAGVISVEGARVITSAGTTSGTILKNNGTTFVASTETYAAPGTSGNVLTSDGTNWTSAAPTVSIGVYGVSDTLRSYSDAEVSIDVTAMTKVKEIKIPFGVAMRIKFDLQGYNSTYPGKGQIYVNGTAKGTLQSNTTTTYTTFSEDITGLNAGDLIQIYGNCTNGTFHNPGYIKNFRIYADPNVAFTVNL